MLVWKSSRAVGIESFLLSNLVLYFYYLFIYRKLFQVYATSFLIKLIYVWILYRFTTIHPSFWKNLISKATTPEAIENGRRHTVHSPKEQRWRRRAIKQPTRLSSMSHKCCSFASRDLHTLHGNMTTRQLPNLKLDATVTGGASVNHVCANKIIIREITRPAAGRCAVLA